MSGRFIVLEGGEGAGKSSNLDYLQRLLEGHGLRVLRTREPGGTPLGEAVRGLLLDPAFAGMEARSELLLMFAARAQHVAQVIRPALDEGVWVISDRFTSSSYAYQGGGRGLPNEAIAWLEAFVQDELRPDLTLLLDTPVEVGLARMRSRGEPEDRIEREGRPFFERVRAAFLAQAEAAPGRFAVIDASEPLERVQVAMQRALEPILAEGA
ncbi:MAG TPA: dTMP kinase [Chromatiales bacterium]|nr:dTMP kinase [Chromatiales bacterium]